MWRTKNTGGHTTKAYPQTVEEDGGTKKLERAGLVHEANVAFQTLR